MAEEQVSPEELLRQVEVADLLVATLTTLVQVGYAQLDEGQTEQTRVAIEALRALLPVLDNTLPAEAVRDLRQATANLQLAYASKVNETSDRTDDDESKGET